MPNFPHHLILISIYLGKGNSHKILRDSKVRSAIYFHSTPERQIRRKSSDIAGNPPLFVFPLCLNPRRVSYTLFAYPHIWSYEGASSESHMDCKISIAASNHNYGQRVDETKMERLFLLQ